jgi:hypothetical protein
MEDEIYYLVHTTDNPNCRTWKELFVAPFNVDDQFPGVFLSIITKSNINSERLFPGKYIMIFSKKLLQQKNYHINFRDYNGILTETNTYYPWDLDKFLEEVKKHSNERTDNEIVFHDNISTKYLNRIIEKQPGKKINEILPREEIVTDEEPNMELKPFYCYPFEDIYTGTDPFTRSSTEWYKTMLKLCNVEFDENDTIEHMVEKAKVNAKELYYDRSKQNISVLEEYVKRKSGGNRKRKHKRKTRRNKKSRMKKVKRKTRKGNEKPKKRNKKKKN